MKGEKLESSRLNARASLIVVASTLIVGCQWIPGTNAYKGEAAKKAVSAKLKDPTSPIYSDIHVVGDGVCGWVNGKNIFGAYSGKVRFVWQSTSQVLIEGADEPNPGIQAMHTCELEHLFTACQADQKLLSASIDSSIDCAKAGMEAVESAYGLRTGAISRITSDKKSN